MLWNISSYGKHAKIVIIRLIFSGDNDYDFMTSDQGSHHSFVKTKQTVSSLKPFTKYHIVVQAYNQYGAGPLSSPIYATTQEAGN